MDERRWQLLLFDCQEKVFKILLEQKRWVMYCKRWWRKQFVYLAAKRWSLGMCLPLTSKTPPPVCSFSASPPLCTVCSPVQICSSVLLCGPAHFSLTACSNKLNTFFDLFMQLVSPQTACVWIFFVACCGLDVHSTRLIPSSDFNR